MINFIGTSPTSSKLMWAENKAMEFNECKNKVDQDSNLHRRMQFGLQKGLICTEGENKTKYSSFCEVIF